MPFFEIELGGKWQAFDADVGKKMADAMSRGASEYRFSAHGQDYVVDFKTMTQKNCKSGTERPIRDRNAKSGGHHGGKHHGGGGGIKVHGGGPVHDGGIHVHTPVPSAPPAGAVAPAAPAGFVAPAAPAPAAPKKDEKKGGAGFAGGLVAGMAVMGGAVVAGVAVTEGIDVSDLAGDAADLGAALGDAAADGAAAAVDAAGDVSDALAGAF